MVADGHADHIQRFTRHRTHGVRIGDYFSIEVEYYKTLGIPGRLYARGSSAQKVGGSTRAIIFQTDVAASGGKDCVNIRGDIVNAMQSILLNLLRQAVGDCAEIDYELMWKLKSNPAVMNAFIPDFMGVSAKDAKKSLLAVLHYGHPRCDLPLLWALAVEMRKASEVILNLPEYAYLAKMFSGRRHPKASRLHYALAKTENEIIQDAIGCIAAATNDRSTVSALIFDEFIVRVDASDVDAVLQVFKEVGEHWGVKIEGGVM